MTGYFDPLEDERPVGVPADAEIVMLHLGEDALYAADVYRRHDVWYAVAVDYRRDEKWVAIAETRELVIEELRQLIGDALS